MPGKKSPMLLGMMLGRSTQPIAMRRVRLPLQASMFERRQGIGAGLLPAPPVRRGADSADVCSLVLVRRRSR